jgi:hypothetical protein
MVRAQVAEFLPAKWRMTLLTAPRVRVLVAHLDGHNRLSSCAVVNEEDLPMPGWVVVARDPDDIRGRDAAERLVVDNHEP